MSEEQFQTGMLILILVSLVGWMVHRELQWQDMGNITKLINQTQQQHLDIQLGNDRHVLLDMQRAKMTDDRLKTLEAKRPCDPRALLNHR